MKKPNFLTLNFAIFCATMNRHTYKLLENRFNDVQIEGKWEINMA